MLAEREAGLEGEGCGVRGVSSAGARTQAGAFRRGLPGVESRGAGPHCVPFILLRPTQSLAGTGGAEAG